jgi:murein DD-endopeptidase MepM/ murein hydrolase activator NlpD
MYPILHFQEHHKARVTSPYGMRPDPFGFGKQVMHYGVDFGGVPRGSLWTSPYAGIVTHTGTHGGRGKVAVVRIEGTRVLQLFQHLDEFRCRVGDPVDPGDPIGTNGISGDVTGPHLHYELRWDDGTPLGSPVWGDPADFTPERARRESDMREYTVKKGDTLTRIANAHGIHPWQQLVDWNRDRYPDIGTGKNALVREGWVLRLYNPATEAVGISRAEFDALTARVKSLESLWAKIKAL